MKAIIGSVGKNCKNYPDDVFVVQTLLNRHRKPPKKLISVDRNAGGETIQAIIEFQTHVVKLERPDGRVDPAGKTFVLLNTDSQWKWLPDVFSRAIEQLAKNVTINIQALLNKQPKKIAWGAKVSGAFKNKAMQVAANLGVSPDYLMACMAFETGETFSPNVPNKAGSGAIGLIQFMPKTAPDLSTTVEMLAAMTAVQQLDYVEKYLKLQIKRQKKSLNTLEDVYMAILYPAAIGNDRNSTLFAKGSKEYTQNAGFDKNSDGKITPAEISTILRAKYEKGLKPGYFG
jgi:hypothetical protein